MAKEPLKNKLRVTNCYYTRDYKEGDEELGQEDGQTTVYAQLESLKSAVGWLKARFKLRAIDESDYQDCVARIDEAFPDLK